MEAIVGVGAAAAIGLAELVVNLRMSASPVVATGVKVDGVATDGVVEAATPVATTGEADMREVGGTREDVGVRWEEKSLAAEQICHEPVQQSWLRNESGNGDLP